MCSEYNSYQTQITEQTVRLSYDICSHNGDVIESCVETVLKVLLNTVGDRTVALNIIARCSITQTPTGQWNIDNVAE